MHHQILNKGEEERLIKVYRIAYLVAGFLEQNLSDAELEELDNWIIASDANMRLFEDLTDPNQLSEWMEQYAEPNPEKRLEMIKARLELPAARSSVKGRRLYWIAAAVAAACLLLVYWFLPGPTKKPSETAPLAGILPVPPGSPAIAAARLFVDDKPALAIDGSKDSSLIPGLARVKAGWLEMNSIPGAAARIRIEVPKQAFLKIQLADRLRIWLNAASVLQISTGRAGQLPEFVLSGEAYFEVPVHTQTPFTLASKALHISVKGTRFSVSDYPGDAIQYLVLFEGKLEVNGRVLLPAQRLLYSNGQLTIDPADTSTTNQWTLSEFRFENESFEQISRQLERWYGVTFVTSRLPNTRFNFRVSRSQPLSRVLQMLESTGQLHFNQEGDRVQVNP